MISIAGHTFRPEALTYIGPVDSVVYSSINTTRYAFELFIGGQRVHIEVDKKEDAIALQKKVLDSLTLYTATAAGY